MTPLPEVAVIDAAVALKWVVGETLSEAAARLRDSRLFAPDLLAAECANALWKKVARGELAEAEADIAAQALEAAPIDLVPTRPLLARSVALAATLSHPAYDCLYLLVAFDRSLPLITADRRLLRTVAVTDAAELPTVIALDTLGT